MKKLQELQQCIDELNELEDYLTERIVDLHEVKGAMQARHAYIFYRAYVMNIGQKLYELKEELQSTEN